MPEPAARRRVGLTRSATDRVVAGVAGGLGERLGVDPVVIRLAFVVLAFAGGAGLLLYLFAWLVAAEPEPGGPAGDQATRRAPPAGSVGTRAVAVGLVVAGLLLLLREARLWLGDGLVWPVALAAFGSAVIWTRGDALSRARLARVASRLPRTAVEPVLTGWAPRGRLVLGILLVVVGMGTFLAANDALAAARDVAAAMLVTVTGLGLILGPWVWRLARQLADERRERIRSEERTEMAAHLHDSVLQTLALIQRAGEPQEMVSLARGQERELRAWLYGQARGGRDRRERNGADLLSTALDEAAARVERLHRVTVESVVVGDCSMDDRLRALVDAAGEAMNNAAKHSGARAVSVYAEVGPEAVNLYVRDEGRGFRPNRLRAGRRGIAGSIRGRMDRHGGTATITSEPNQGTEVHLVLPRRQA
jgi:signal transduction histidine kinase